MVGGRDFAESHFNRAMQAQRQPGSAFKPFVYAAALEAGYSPASVISHLDDAIGTPQGAWTPEDEHSSASSMTLRTGLRTSSNRAAVRLLQEVGIGRTVRYAKSLGVGDVPAVPSLALGSGEVTLQAMTAAYAAFANHGLVPKPMVIRRVEDRDGRVLFDARDSSTRAVSDVTAFLMSSMMADVINAGTGARARCARVHAAGGRENRHDQRVPRRLVRRLHAEDRHRRVGGLRSAAHDSAERLRRGRRGSALGQFHEGRHARRQARVADAAGWRHERDGLPRLGQARNRHLPGRDPSRIRTGR